MRFITKHINGDRAIWAIVALLSVFSFLPVYSASSNLVYVLGIGSVTGHLIKHVAIVLIGMSIMYAVHRIPFKYFSGLSVITLPIVWLLLIYTALQGNLIEGQTQVAGSKSPFLVYLFKRQLSRRLY